MLLQLRKRLLFNIIGIYKLVTWSKSEGNSTPDRRQSQMLILSMNVDQKSFERELSIAIYRDWRQMANENTVSSDFWFVFVDC